MSFSLIDEVGDTILNIVDEVWMGYGECASGGNRLDDFFAEETRDEDTGIRNDSTEQTLAAKRICVPCEVRAQCLAWVFEREERHRKATVLEEGKFLRWGIFGGLSPSEREIAVQAEDPVAFGMKVLEEQVKRRIVTTPIPRWQSFTTGEASTHG